MNVSTIISQALELTSEDRADLARRLIESLDTESDQGAETLWMDEAERRAGELDRGEVTPVSAEALEQRVRARLR